MVQVARVSKQPSITAAKLTWLNLYPVLHVPFAAHFEDGGDPITPRVMRCCQVSCFSIKMLRGGAAAVANKSKRIPSFGNLEAVLKVYRIPYATSRRAHRSHQQLVFKTRLELAALLDVVPARQLARSMFIYAQLKTVRTCALPTLPVEPRTEHLPRLLARGAVGPSSSGSVS